MNNFSINTAQDTANFFTAVANVSDYASTLKMINKIGFGNWVLPASKPRMTIVGGSTLDNGFVIYVDDVRALCKLHFLRGCEYTQRSADISEKVAVESATNVARSHQIWRENAMMHEVKERLTAEINALQEDGVNITKVFKLIELRNEISSGEFQGREFAPRYQR